MRRTLLLLFSVALVVPLAAALPTAGERFERARLAWDAGDYVKALEGFKAVVKDPAGDRYFERIALLTGELYRVTELTADGRQPRFSPDGRYLSYETGSPAATKIVAVGDAAGAATELPGTGTVFSPAGSRVAYLRPKADPELTKVRGELEQLQARGSAERQKVTELQRQLARLVARHSEIVVRDLSTGGEQVAADGGLLKSALAWSGDGREVYFVGTGEQDPKSNDVYATSEGSAQPRAITSGPGFKATPTVSPNGGRYLLYNTSQASPFPAAGQAPAGRGQGGGAARQYVLLSLADGTTVSFSGSSAEFSADGSTVVFVVVNGTEYSVQVAKLGAAFEPRPVKKSPDRIATATLSPDGSRVAFEMPFTRNTEIFSVKADGTGEIRVSREIQPDRAPRFLTPTTLIAIKGESRHSRSYLYNLDGSAPIRLFHNNTVRTIAPEYEWVASADGKRLLIVAERDGDTISAERGVYLLDLTQRISHDDLVRRLDDNLAVERALRQRGTAMFQPIVPAVKAAADAVSITRLYEYEEALFAFDSKYITQPGNKPAGEYLFEMFKSFGYEPEYQWFTAQNVKTANVLATLRGTVNPELVYVVSAHYDSNLRSPGGDDNNSATAVLLETARVMAKTPMPATIVFAAFTGEEAGLLGSREFVRQAVAKKVQLAGALNNDMIGWTNDHRLDNTIRYSNPGIRDLQHAASFLFSRMITYDARYFKSTDAQAYYDAYGDIVGGFGSYPVLGNPYYHQATDLLETVNHELLVEATRANVASIMGLASMPSRITGLTTERTAAGAVKVSWAASPEKGTVRYVVNYGPSSNPAARTLTVATPRVQLPAGPEALHVAVRAVNARGLAGWDWARTVAAAKTPGT